MIEARTPIVERAPADCAGCGGEKFAPIAVVLSIYHRDLGSTLALCEVCVRDAANAIGWSKLEPRKRKPLSRMHMKIPRDVYEEIAATLDAEAARRDADYRCWMTVDLGDGEVALLAWFGTTEKMRRLKRQLRALPPADFALKARNASADKIAAALHPRPDRRRTPSKRKAKP